MLFDIVKRKIDLSVGRGARICRQKWRCRRKVPLWSRLAGSEALRLIAQRLSLGLFRSGVGSIFEEEANGLSLNVRPFRAVPDGARAGGERLFEPLISDKGSGH